MDLRLILIAHAAIAKGLDILRHQPPAGFDLASANEDLITFHLHLVLSNDLFKHRRIPGLDRRVFSRIEREPKVVNFDGQKFDKMPDLVFWLNRDCMPVLESHDGLFVECKPVDHAHPAGQDYCDRGLIRFVNGDYAWAMQEAMMVAYVRHGPSIAASLLPALRKRHQFFANISDPAPITHCQPERDAEPLHVSTHARSFVWPVPHGRACDIQVFHSWHKCS